MVLHMNNVGELAVPYYFLKLSELYLLYSLIKKKTKTVEEK